MMTRTIVHRLLGAMAVSLGLSLGVGDTAAGHSHGPGGPGYHEGDIVLGSTERSGGRLAVLYDFSSVVRVTLGTTIGGVGLYTTTSPGFDATVKERAEELFPLQAGTPIHVELLDNDGGRAAWKIGDTVLDAPGDRGLVGVQTATAPSGIHGHGEFQLRTTDAPGTWSETRLRFRFIAPESAYAPSEPFELLLTNAHLDPMAYGSQRVDRGALACARRILAEVVRLDTPPANRLAAATAQCGDRLPPDAAAALFDMVTSRTAALAASACTAYARDVALRMWRAHIRTAGACFLGLERERAWRAAGVPVDLRAALRACSGSDDEPGTMLGRLTQARQRALATTRRHCGAAARKLVERAECEANETLSALFAGAGAKEALAAFTMPGERSLDTHFPCLRAGFLQEEE